MARMLLPPLRLAAVLLCSATGVLLSAAGPGSPLPSGAPNALHGDSAVPDFERDVVPVLDELCSRCHEGEDAEAGVDFSLYLDEESALAEAQLWNEVAWQLWKHAMPPPSRREQPSAAQRQTVLDWVDAQVAPLLPPSPGIPMRRLSNREYQRAVQDLTGVDFPAESFFPTDPVLAGFDNQAGALSMSATRFEKLVDAADRIAREAVALPEPEEPPMRRRGGGELRGVPVRGDLALLNSRLTAYGDFRAPRDGRYRVIVRAYGRQAGPELCQMSVARKATVLKRFTVAATPDAPEDYAVEVELKEGPHELSASFLNDYYQPEHPDRDQRDRNLYVMSIALEGPLDRQPPTALQTGLVERHGDDLEAQVMELASRAWRGEAANREVRALLALSEKEDAPEVRLQRALEGILVSPRFLFRTDGQRADGEARAARLGLLLYGGLPDRELREAAAAGRLQEEAGLRAEVRRMLADPRATLALGEDFATQWLQLRILEGAQPDPDVFPDFDEELRASMREESLRLFAHLLQEDLPVAELLDADYSFVDARLAAHYGLAAQPIDEPSDALTDQPDGEWRRVSLVETPRRGLLGHASVLTMTSTPVRTSAVIRGKWLLEVLLDAPPPPPPPGAGSLDDAGVDQNQPQRALLAQHRERAECAVCHDTLDPLGLALENYGPLGQWRESDGRFPVDSSAVLPDGRQLQGPLELAGILAEDEEALARGLLGRLATYAMGRPVGPSDRAWLQHALDSMPGERPTMAALVETVAVAVCQLPPANEAR